MNIDFNNFNAYSKQLLNEIKEVPKIQKTDDDTLLREQTDAFEALIVKNMLDIALKDDNTLFPKAAGHDIYQSMYKETLSQSLSGSFGFSELLFNYLKDLQK